MALPSFVMHQGEQWHGQSTQNVPAAEWLHSEYTGPSQLPMAVVSIGKSHLGIYNLADGFLACGIVIVLLLAYVVYLQRSYWQSMIAKGRKQMRRITGRREFPMFHDDLVERLDALEKALRQDVISVSTPISQRPSCGDISKASLRSGDTSFTQYTHDDAKLSLSLDCSPPVLPLPPNSSTVDANLMSEKSFYSQSGNSFNLVSIPLPVIQIHPVDSSLSISSFDLTNQPRSLSAPSFTFPSQPKRYGRLGEPHDEPVSFEFILPEESQPSFSSMMTQFTIHTSDVRVDGEAPILQQETPSTWGSPLLRTRMNEAERIWEESPFDSSLHTPISSPPSTPSTPGSNLSFEQLRKRLDVMRCSIIFSSGSIHTTLDDVHEDIKRSYGVFLAMLDNGLFDSPEKSPHMEHLKRVDPTTFRDSRADSSLGTDLAQPEFDLDMDEEGAKEFNTRFISMLIGDLEQHTLRATEQRTCSSMPGDITPPPRAQNPVMSQLENEDIPIVCLDGLSSSPYSDASPDHSMETPNVVPSPAYSNAVASPDIYAITPHERLVVRSADTHRGPRTQVSRVVSANRFSMIASRPVCGDLHLRKFDLDYRLDPGMFGFGRAARWNESKPLQSTPSWSSYESMFEGHIGASHELFTVTASTPFTPSPKLDYSRSLPSCHRRLDAGSRTTLSSPILPPGLGLAFPNLTHSDQQATVETGAPPHRVNVVLPQSVWRERSITGVPYNGATERCVDIASRDG